MKHWILHLKLKLFLFGGGAVSRAKRGIRLSPPFEINFFFFFLIINSDLF